MTSCHMSAWAFIFLLLALIEWYDLFYVYKMIGMDEARRRFAKTEAMYGSNVYIEFRNHLLFTWLIAIGCTLAAVVCELIHLFR